MSQAERILAWAAVAHLLVAMLALVWLCFPATAILGVHPASKPLKFGLSIGLFLGSLAYLLPLLAVSPALRRGFAWTLVVCMIAEMLPIAVQALRGTTSHFNTRTVASGAWWNLMFVAIVVTTIAMLAIAWLATVRPLQLPNGQALNALTTAAWRAALWIFLRAAYSGFAMGGRMQHSVGGPDGGAGLPVVNWSTQHGDLRVAHFFALHALQTLPVAAWVLHRIGGAAWLRWGALAMVVVLHMAVTLWTLARALAGRPSW